MSDDHSLSDDEEEMENANYTVAEVTGKLSKWTNYIHGWQDRFIILKDGTLSYYKSENDTTFGCRGAISIHRATVKQHEFDECRFDVSVNDCVWYLRAETKEERQKWIDALETYKSESGYGSENSLRRHGSALSLASGNLSQASSSSFKKGRGLREKLNEMETFREILCRQVDTLQSYFDACAEAVGSIRASESSDNVMEDDTDLPEQPTLEHLASYAVRDRPLINKEMLMQHGNHALDFKGEAITFKATTAGTLVTLAHCIELMNQREDSWKRRLEREIEKRRKLDEIYKQVLTEARQQRQMVGGPDFEEGPHCSLNEDEFFDAVDAGLDKLESEEEKRMSRRWLQPKVSFGLSLHPLAKEINDMVTEQLNYAKEGVGEGGWTLFAEEGEMKMYKREVEEDGMVCDPLKAVHSVKGITGREMCHYFFDPDVRMEWETTLDSTRVVERIGEDTLVFHQIHKRVWPATQRDSVFWSHMRKVPNREDPDSQDIVIVCNNSTDHYDIPLGKCLRLKLTVSLVCQTYISPPQEDREISRDDITCKISYCATVNPGGWAPASVLRAVYKREYPRFLKRFTQYVKDRTADKSILF